MQVNAHIARKATPAPVIADAKNAKDLEHYFESSKSGIDVVEDGLKGARLHSLRASAPSAP